MSHAWRELRRLLITILLRSSLGFSALTIVGGATMRFLDGDNPLRSDDPYLIGFLCGGFAAAMGVVYTIAEVASTTRIRASIFYGAVVCLWALLLIALTAGENEGADIGRFVAIAHFLSGAISWPLFAFRIPRSITAFTLAIGVAVLVMYGIVAVQMASMN